MNKCNSTDIVNLLEETIYELNFFKKIPGDVNWVGFTDNNKQDEYDGQEDWRFCEAPVLGRTIKPVKEDLLNEDMKGQLTEK